MTPKSGQIETAPCQEFWILGEVRTHLGEGRRATVVFDRGGWSPKLFRQMLGMEFAILTDRKGHHARYPRKDFREETQVIDGKRVTYQLREGHIRLAPGLRMRSIVRLRADGRQGSIVTTREDLSGVEAAYRLFDRWRQENYFKYVEDEFEIDALATYAVEPDDPERTVPNPARRRLDREVAEWRQRIERLEAEIGRALDANRESQRRSVRGVKIALAQQRRRLAEYRSKLERCKRRRKTMPPRIPVGRAVRPGEKPQKLAVECKHFMNILKSAVYRAESALFEALRPHYKGSEKEGRTLLREAFQSSGALDIRGGELCVTLDPLSAPCRSEALARLCAEVTAAAVRIPGTSLRLRFAVRGVECLK